MNRKNTQNSNGISVCDSIVMSVKIKRSNLRKPFSVLIAIIGFASVILSFLGMFELEFDKSRIFIASCGFSIFYILLTIIDGKAFLIYGASAFVYLFALYKKMASVSLGFKYVYNIIYSVSFHTEIKYYKGLNKALESDSVTTFVFFYVWLLAIIVYFFTISRPNPILPLLITFPVIEIGLYNGIELPVFRGMAVVAYWLSLLAMCTIDVGEYSGGQSGFVRKNNLFFPKRHMKLKVTEKCGAFIMASILAVTAVTIGVLKVTNYKRSDEIQQMRKDLSEAANSFSVDNLAESLANISSALGFDIKYDNHKLGNFDHISYKNVTDLTVEVAYKPDVAIYLKDYAGAVYNNNEWNELPDETYNDERYTNCEKYGINPQEFADTLLDIASAEAINPNAILIKSHLKNKKLFVPYCFENPGTFDFNKDNILISKENNISDFAYKFNPMTAEKAAQYNEMLSRTIIPFDSISDDKWKNNIKDFFNSKGLTEYVDSICLDYDISIIDPNLSSNGKAFMALLLEMDYRSFVYDNYLQVPDTDAMKEVRNAYSDILDNADISTAQNQISVLNAIRDKISSESIYSLRPGKTPANRDFVNYFLLENHKGYCTHFATSGVILARMAGIPARFATGYVLVGDDFTVKNRNSSGLYSIDVKDNRSHAWAEVYISGFGWLPFEFTAGYNNFSINTQPVQTTAATTTTTITETTTKASSPTTASHSKKKTSSTLNTTTTAASTNPTGGGTTKNPPHIPPAVLELIRWFLIAALAVAGVLLRRYVILRIRKNRFSGGKRSDRVAYIYAHAEKLLTYKNIENSSRKYTNFAEDVENSLGGIYFNNGSFSEMTQIALRSQFSNSKPTNEEIEFCKNTVNSIANKIYQKSGFFEKLYIKYIKTMI